PEMLMVSTTPRLSSCEMSILEAIADGCQSKEIACSVARSKPTVEAMVRMLCVKFNARTRAHLIARAMAYGIIDPARYARD
ncbi:MAG TPA: LuxR C-terminal-related transcriptional regulator, partial [Candidatus Baltobacteraceae bacterium]